MSPGFVVVCCVSAAGLLVPAALRADPFDEFRVPDHRTLNWTASGSGSGQRQLYDNSGLYVPRDAGVDRFHEGALSSRIEWGRHTDPAVTTLRAAVGLSGHRQTIERSRLSVIDTRILTHEEHSVSRRAAEYLEVNAYRDQFLTSAPLLWRISVGAVISDEQQWSSRDLRAETTDVGFQDGTFSEQASRQKRYSSALTSAVGIGAGRVRNATGLYEALVLERRLRAAGAIARPLSPEARRRLGALMYVRTAYTGTRDRPARDLWEEIARILRDDGAIEEPPSPAVTLRLMEPFFGSDVATGPDGLPDSPIARLVGAQVVFELQNRHLRESAHLESSNSFDSFFDGAPPYRSTSSTVSKWTYDDVRVAVTAAYQRPLGLRWQLELTGSAVTAARRSLAADYFAIARATWLVTDRWRGALGPRIPGSTRSARPARRLATRPRRAPSRAWTTTSRAPPRCR
jgi:hypothetical protein